MAETLVPVNHPDAVDRFDVHVRADRGRKLVLVSSILGGTAVVAGLVLSQPVLVLFALVLFAVALYNYPLIGHNEAHLSATLHGLAIDGLGTVDWRSIDHMALSEDSASPTLLCALNQTLEASLKETDETSALRTIQVNIWKLQGGATLAINLDRVQEPADEIFQAFKTFHTRARGPL